MNAYLMFLAFLSVASIVYAQKKIPDIVIGDEVHCMLACKPGEFLNWKECRCVSIDDFTPNPPVSTTTTEATTCFPLRCPLIQRLFPCAEYEADDNGCPTCRCKCPKVTPSQCPTDCKNGLVWTKDAKGCKVCTCAPRPHPVKICPPVCAIYCPHGNILDKNGCPTCRCKSGDGQAW